MYLRTFIIKKFGTATKIVWLPKAWGFQKGDLVHIEAKINKTTYHDTNIAWPERGKCDIARSLTPRLDVVGIMVSGLVYLGLDMD